MGGTLSTGDERLQAHVPLLLHPSPRRVAFLGLGTGITAGAALLHPVEQLSVVELLPEVVDVARDDFAEANLGVVGDARVRVVADDARTWLTSRRGEFDVVVGDLFVPWRRGEAALYTVEQFEAARDALAPGGLFCQWVPLFQLSDEQFPIVVRTFLVAFPQATLWRGDFNPNAPAVALVGRRDGAPLDAVAADQNVTRLVARPDVSNPYLADPAGLWLHLIGSVDARDPWLASARVSRDSQPWLELLSPFTHVGTDADRGPLVGRRLTSLLDQVRARPVEGTPLAGLDRQHAAWRDAGADLWRASLLALDGRPHEADALGFATLAALPTAIQVAVTGGPLDPTALRP